MALLDRLFGITHYPPDPAGYTNGNGQAGHAPEHGKGVSLIDARNAEFYSPDGTRTIMQVVGGSGHDTAQLSVGTAYAAAAYCHAAVRYRAQKVAEAPLMVVEEDAEDGSEEWLADHQLAELLDMPSPDYDMGELLQRTQTYIDITGSAVWVKDANLLGRAGRLTPYSGAEIAEIRPARGRIRGDFVVKLNGREETLPAERVIYFHELNPGSWVDGTSLVEVALSWLNLGQAARAATHDILNNAIFPPVIIQADPAWNPEPAEYDAWKAGLRKYASREHKGEPLGLTGGGKATKVGLTLKDIVPTDILEHVESVVAAVFGVPAIVLQFMVGIRNSPWSQMAEARRMAYEDTIEPLWRQYEKRLTRQLLWSPLTPGGRPLETSRSRFIRFDTTKIRALQVDRQKQADIAAKIAGFASENEQRAIMGLEPKDHPEADLTPTERAKLTPPPPARDEDEGAEDEQKSRHRWQTKQQTLEEETEALRWNATADGHEAEVLIAAMLLLEDDRRAVRNILAGTALVSLTPAAAARITAELASVFSVAGTSGQAWRRTMFPLIGTIARSGVGLLPAALDLAPDELAEYAAREAAFLITSVTDTTQQAVRAAVEASLRAEESVEQLAARIESLGEFSTARARLIAQTETTRVMNGASEEAARIFSQRTGVAVTRTWHTQEDDRVRPEHAVQHGEQRPVGEPFTNGRLVPDEPNCRCFLTFEVAE